MLIADRDGPLEAKALAAAVRKLGAAYPALSAHVRFTPVMRRPYWSVPADAAFEQAVEYEHHLIDAADQDADAPLRRALNDPVDPMAGPQLRLVHVQTSPHRHRLGLRWAHPLMDMEGGHLLFRQLHALLDGEPLTLGQDPRAVLPRPYRWTFPRSFLRVWQGRLRHARYALLRQPRIVARPVDDRKICGFQLRCYDAAFRRRFEEQAKQRTQPGPLRYTRALMVAIARTYLAMAAERGRPRKHYLYSHALPLPRQTPRPGVHGNHVVVPWIAFAEADLADRRLADSAARQQFSAYVSAGRAEAVWEMYRATMRWPFPLTRSLVTHRTPRGAACCTTYYFGDDPARLGPARITNLAGAGPANCHPGWLVGNTTFGKTMSISVTHFNDYFDPPSVAEFMDRLEHEMTS